MFTIDMIILIILKGIIKNCSEENLLKLNSLITLFIISYVILLFE